MVKYKCKEGRDKNIKIQVCNGVMPIITCSCNLPTKEREKIMINLQLLRDWDWDFKRIYFRVKIFYI